ncbi:MAG: cytochrome C [Gammaproteobacteria bacterium]|nr:MAG: cytochrome C [Gammaproteobacteria bacterium]
MRVLRHGSAILALIALAMMTPSSQAAERRLERLLMPGPLVQGHARYEDECERCHQPFSKVLQSRLCRDCHDKVDRDIRTGEGFHGRIPDIEYTECRHCHTDHKGRRADILLLNESTFDHGRTDFLLEGAHRKLECLSCHRAGHKFREAPHECSACHREDDVHRGELGKQCDKCHDSSIWKSRRFNHDNTRFPLRQRHRQVDCAACHPGQRYRDLPKKCVGCHRINDPHGARYGDKCQDCHSERGWKRVSFDHDRDTRFRLKGSHKKVDCDSCHTGDLYHDKLKKNCMSCHRKDDVHHGSNGRKCQECHNEKSWKKSQFDHDRDTRFRLRGRHRSLSCNTCHRQPADKVKLKRDCYSCHRNNDVHEGRFGEKCDSCHTSRRWNRPRFNHNLDTDYPLRGEHARTPCNDCHHRYVKQERLTGRCYQCHREDDVHQGKQGRECQRCHDEKGWSGKVVFDHDQSRFPLIGLHATVTCEECHLSAEFDQVKRRCNDCHEKDDHHKRTLGTDCARCHTANGWELWRFDHDRQTDYPLTGTHAELQCAACHTEPVEGKIELTQRCYDCHRKDDVHRRGFGLDCGRCHNTRDFRDLEMLH